MQALLDKLKAIWRTPTVSKAAHTFWQAFLAVFMLGVPMVVHALNQHQIAVAKGLLISLVTASLAAGLSAAKTAFVSWREG